MATGAPRTAAEKTLVVLDALSEHSRIADIAAATRLSKPTVHRILQTLVRHGYARSADNGRYVGGPRILALAGRYLQRLDLPSQVRPLLRELQRHTGWTVHLALLADDEAVYVDKVEGDNPYHLASRVGMSLHLHSTSIGKSILATMSDAQVRAYAARTKLPARTPHTLVRVSDLLADLRLVRRRGWAEDREENEAGVCAVGAAVRDHVGECVGAVSAAALVHRMSEDAAAAHGRLVVDTARRISAALGAPVDGRA